MRNRQVTATSPFPMCLRFLSQLLGSLRKPQSLETGVTGVRCWQQPPRQGWAGVRAPPRGVALPSSMRLPERGQQRLQRGARRARCIFAERSPRPWRCSWGRPPAPRRSGRTVSARRWPGRLSRAPTWRGQETCARILRTPLYQSAPSGPKPTQSNISQSWGWGWGWGRVSGKTPRILGDFESREPFQRGFWIRTRLPGFKSWS